MKKTVVAIFIATLMALPLYSANLTQNAGGVSGTPPATGSAIGSLRDARKANRQIRKNNKQQRRTARKARRSQNPGFLRGLLRQGGQSTTPSQPSK
jgi:uncharacterized membrane protein